MRGAELLVLALALAMPGVASAADAPPPSAAAAPPATIDPGAVDSSDPQTQALQVEYQRALLRAEIARVRFASDLDDYQANMYRHHQFWTDAAAVAVYFITFFGLFCAAVQFRLWARLRGIAVDGEKGPSAGVAELPGGAKIDSPFLGVVILFLSLGFFYLYLTNVYPILSVAELEAKRAAASDKPSD